MKLVPSEVSINEWKKTPLRCMLDYIGNIFSIFGANAANK